MGTFLIIFGSWFLGVPQHQKIMLFGIKFINFYIKTQLRTQVQDSGSGLRLRTQVEDSGCGLWLRSQVEDSGSGLRLRSQAGLRFHNKNALVLANRCVQNYTDGPPSPHKLARRYTGLPAQYQNIERPHRAAL